MKLSCLIVCGHLDNRFHEYQRDRFCGDEDSIFQLSFLIISNFGEAEKSSLLSNDQAGHPFNVGSIQVIYSIPGSHETTDFE